MHAITHLQKPCEVKHSGPGPGQVDPDLPPTTAPQAVNEAVLTSKGAARIAPDETVFCCRSPSTFSRMVYQ